MFNCCYKLSKIDIQPLDSKLNINIDADSKQCVWDGWGTSLAWWANAIGGTHSEVLVLSLVFSSEDVKFNGRNYPGLGLNIARYNIGGWGDITDSPPRNVNWYRKIEGFQTKPDDWNFERDQYQVGFLTAACQKHSLRIEFFCNAPMFWMTKENCSAGGKLRKRYETSFVNYVVKVIQHANENWQLGNRVESIELFNEPSSKWWRFGKSDQEGCHIPRNKQLRIVQQLRQALICNNLNVSIALSDENNLSDALKSFKLLKKETDRLNVHSYNNGTGPFRDNYKREELAKKVRNANKVCWMSEYGDGDHGGACLAQTIFEDIFYLKVNAWIYWQVVEADNWGSNGWGLIEANFGDKPMDNNRGKVNNINNKYFVMAHFTRFIRPGAQILNSRIWYVAIGLNSDSTLAITIGNFKKEDAQFNITLKNFQLKFTKYTLVTTTFDGKQQFKKSVSDIGESLEINLNALSINSVLIS